MSNLSELRERLVDSQLLAGEAVDSHLQTWREETGSGATATEGFVDWLIDQGHITEFQGDAIGAGHTGPFMLGPYRVHEQVAPGRLGGTFRAVHEDSDQAVSLKIYPGSLKDDPEKEARVGREMRIFTELHHPNVLQSYQLGQVGDMYYVAMEDLRGETLANRLERETRLPYDEACRILRDVAQGLEHLHQNDVVHRDLCPRNIWLTDHGVPKIMEFGGAHDWYAAADTAEYEVELTSAETVIGQYEYTAPEQTLDARNADARSDIYALGCILYHCLAGHPPFVEKNPVKLALKHAQTPPPQLSKLVEDIPQQIDETLSGMLAKDPAKRFQTAKQVAFALDQYAPKEKGEAVVVVEASQQYLDWVHSQHPSKPSGASEDAVAMSPQLTEFLMWMSRRNTRRKKRTAK